MNDIERETRRAIAAELASKAAEYRFYAAKELRDNPDRAHVEQAAKYLYAAEVVEQLIPTVL